ncbi:hypothetical protein [Pacificoceanicola onchidii]|uniref:hypothetical protein n=1 Tax=Pacificoceanicola onchidii TaxID=2562685 RepID=UPI0010A40C43|nr:hypothetical protein [Pacificoceanicola onchidii]
MDWEAITVEETASLTRTPCECCGKTTLQADGDLHHGNVWISCYSVRWSNCSDAPPPLLTVYVGDGSDGARADQRWAIRSYWRSEGLGLDDWSAEERAAITLFTLLDREDVLDTPFATEYWSMIDAIIMKDSRLEALRA